MEEVEAPEEEDGEGAEGRGNRMPRLLLQASPQSGKKDELERELMPAGGREPMGRRGGRRGQGRMDERKREGRRKGKGRKRGDEFMRAYGEVLKGQMRAGGSAQLFQVRIPCMMFCVWAHLFRKKIM